MSVREIVEQFTDDDFTLIVYDLATESVVYHDNASEVYDSEAGSMLVVSIDPPSQAYEITLNVDTSEDIQYEYIEDNVLEEI